MAHPKIEVIEFTEGHGSPEGRITLCGAWPDRFINIGVETDGDYGSSTVVCASPGEAKELRDKLIGIYPLPAPKLPEPVPSKVTYDYEGNFEKTIRTGENERDTIGFVRVRQNECWKDRAVDFIIKADNGGSLYFPKDFCGTISADCATQLRDVLNLLYPVSAGEVAKPAAPPDAPPYTPEVGDRVVVCDKGLTCVAAAAGRKATIIAVDGGCYKLKFNEFIPSDGGLIDNFWIAYLNQFSPASSTQYAPMVGDRVVVGPDGLCGVQTAAGMTATIADSYIGYDDVRRFDIFFDYFVESDSGFFERSWTAKEGEFSLA